MQRDARRVRAERRRAQMEAKEAPCVEGKRGRYRDGGMDGRKDGWIDGWMVGWREGRMDGGRMVDSRKEG